MILAPSWYPLAQHQVQIGQVRWLCRIFSGRKPFIAGVFGEICNVSYEHNFNVTSCHISHIAESAYRTRMHADIRPYTVRACVYIPFMKTANCPRQAKRPEGTFDFPSIS